MKEIPAAGTFVRIAACPQWNGYDETLLIALKAVGAKNFEEFSLNEWSSKIGELVPGFRFEDNDPNPPVVGVWIDGALKEVASGYRGRLLAVTHCLLSHSYRFHNRVTG